jgi:glycosyltransferase involved in cell wall biosynthesis
VTVLTPSFRKKGLKTVEESLKNQTYKNFEWIVQFSNPVKGCDLCHQLNLGLKKAKGEWIVMLQDYMKAPRNGIERFLEEANDTRLITGSVPVTTDWQNIKYDWRDWHEPGPIEPFQWEANWAIAPRQAFFDVGGYDEEYDSYWSNENVNIAERMAMIGYAFWIQPDNKAVHFLHDEFEKHPWRHKFNPEFHNRVMEETRNGTRPVKLHYLDQ